MISTAIGQEKLMSKDEIKFLVESPACHSISLYLLDSLQFGDHIQYLTISINN
jgi:hypothetical protein